MVRVPDFRECKINALVFKKFPYVSLENLNGVAKAIAFAEIHDLEKWNILKKGKILCSGKEHLVLTLSIIAALIISIVSFTPTPNKKLPSSNKRVVF